MKLLEFYFPCLLKYLLITLKYNFFSSPKIKYLCVFKNLLRYFIKLTYNGSAYHGWQTQPNGVSIQSTLEEAMTLILKEKISILGAGRTDKGVHAKEMIAHFDVTKAIGDTSDIVYKLNSYLPASIAIDSIVRVEDTAHARFDALDRTYEYHIITKKNPFWNGQGYFYYTPLDIKKMNRAAKILFKYNDFECFSKTNTDVKTFLCTIKYAKWKRTEVGYVFTITANRFLRNMVRAIAGSMIEIGLGKKNCEWMHEVIKSKDRSKAGFSVPAEGLYLTEIRYPKNITIDE